MIKSNQSEKVQARRAKTSLGGFEKTLTIQSHKDLCCVDNIMAQYRNTGIITHVNNSSGSYLDMTAVGDFTDAQNMIRAAEEQFMELPASTRLKFNNDPAELLDFVKNPNNREKAVEMGFLQAPVVAEKPAPKTPETPVSEPSQEG